MTAFPKSILTILTMTILTTTSRWLQVKKGRKRGFGETRRESLVKVYHVMEAICKMEPAWMKVAESNFRLGSYKDANGQLRPCYQLTKTECLYIATKFNDEARAKLVLRWEELERAAPAHLST